MNRELEQFLLKSLQEKVPCTSWNEFRRMRPGVNDLSGITLDKYKIENANFCNMNLCGTKCKHGEFKNTDFSGSDLFDTEISHVVFEKCSFEGCDFSNSTLKYCQFNGCNMKDSSFKNAQIHWPVFKRCNMFGADFLTTNLVKPDLRELDLSATRLNINKVKEATTGRVYSPKQCEIEMPDCRNHFIDQEFEEKTLREICSVLSVATGVFISVHRKVDVDRGPITTRLIGMTLEKFIDMLCAVYNLEVKSNTPGSIGGGYVIKEKIIKRLSATFTRSALETIGRFIDLQFNVTVGWETPALAKQRVDISFSNVTLRELCIQICTLVGCRVATHVAGSDGKLVIREDREVDFNKVKHLHFYQI
ncbi:pentapeptide repeat-containing protein [Planctomycetota bacterium]